MTDTTFNKYYAKKTSSELAQMARGYNKGLKKSHDDGELLSVKSIPTSYKAECVKKDKKGNVKAELGYSIYDKNGSMYASLFSQTFLIGWKGKEKKTLALISTRDRKDYTDNSARVVSRCERAVKDYIKALGLDTAKYDNFLNNYRSFLANGIHAYLMATDESYRKAEEAEEQKVKDNLGKEMDKSLDKIVKNTTKKAKKAA